MLKVGDKAPDFKLSGDDGETHHLASLKGKNVVVYFYPKDLTPGCTTEACEFRDAKASFAEKETVIFGISKDSLASHARFRGMHGLSFVLLSDPELTVHKAYEAYGEKKLYGKTTVGVIRSTFLINKQGKIAHIWKNVRVAGHVSSVLEAAQKL